MRLPYLQEILECPDINAIEEYAIWGGVPRYWELRLQEKSLEQALSYHLLSPYGILYDELLRLLFNENPRNAKKSLYKIADPFMNFYFTFVVPNRSLS